MPKLYFRYGTMNSSKTANLLMVYHNYKVKEKKILLIKPKLDDRFGSEYISSRVGIQEKADLIVDESYNLLSFDHYHLYSCILVDECQFLTEIQIEQLRKITNTLPVICYGLKTDFTTKLFPASKRLIELADSIEEIKTICSFCDKKAIITLKHNNGIIIRSGETQIDLGVEDKYMSCCWSCWDVKEKC
jgi:thymidine kinase